MRLYECTIILRPELSKTKVEEAQNEIISILTSDGGTTSRHEYWGLRSLAYPIKKLTRAHYIFFNAEASPKAIIEMERKMRIREDVLRYLTVTVDELSEEPSPIMQSKVRSENAKDGGGRSDRSDKKSSEEKAA
ncbi:MAG: 30S ribosomal protein S6 [Pseudomonadota bacterium]